MLIGIFIAAFAVWFAIAIPLIITSWNNKPWAMELKELDPEYIRRKRSKDESNI